MAAGATTVESAQDKVVESGPGMRPALEPHALICLGWVPWGRSWKRNQSMVYQLSRLPLFERTVFVNPRAMWVSSQFRSEEGSFGQRLGRMRDSLPHRHDEKIHVCSQWHVIPFKGLFPAAVRFEEWMFRSVLRRYLGNRPFVLLNNHPNFYSPAILDELMAGARLSVFDLSDDFVEFFTDQDHRALFRRNIEHCCTHSDLVFTVNQHVADKYGPHNPNTFVVQNSTNFDNFSRPAYRPVRWLEKIRKRGGAVLGCTGIINRIRIDYELLEELVTLRATDQFVFVGNCDPSFLELAARHDNVHHHGQVPYQELPNWIHAFDAALIPFRLNEHTRGNDLLKFHDYLAMGKSIVCSDTGGVEVRGPDPCRRRTGRLLDRHRCRPAAGGSRTARAPDRGCPQEFVESPGA